MSATKLLQLGLIIPLLLAGCTDRRAKLFSGKVPAMPPSPIELVATIQFDGNATDALQMTVHGESLYLTGRPFGFSRWDLGSDPESPRLTFAASDNTDAFSPYPQFGFWTPDSFAQGALAVISKLALMSGAAGLSLADVSETHTPVEVGRFPSEKIDDVTVTRDPAFVYSALTHHPTLPIAYGFAEQDYAYTLSVGQKGVKIIEKAAYSESTVCCALGAATAAGRVLVAMRGSLWIFDLLPDGRLGEASQFEGLQAVNVVATGQYIFVQHEPTYGRASGASNAAGIYVFSSEGAPVGYLPVQPIRFAVYRNYLYANTNHTDISVFRIR